MFITGYDANAEDLAHHPLAVALGDGSVNDTRLVSLGFDCSPLQFVPGTVVKRCLHIDAAGGAPGADKKPGKGDFTFGPVSNQAFSIDTTKGSVEAGSTKQITFSFSSNSTVNSPVEGDVNLTLSCNGESTTYSISFRAVGHV